MSVPRLEELRRRPDGAQLLDRLLSSFQRFVIFPDRHAAVATVLWVAATYGQTVWTHAPRLVITSPEKRCGKSRLLDLLAATSCNAVVTMDISTAALFRRISESDPPTLLMDEADAIFSSRKVNRDHAEELRGLINAGFGRGRPTLRCVGPQQAVTAFDTFCMIALAGIGDFAPDTVKDRAISITLRRRAAGERVQPFRARRDAPAFAELAADLACWLTPLLDQVGAAEPDMPVEDREADTWEPLIALADAAGAEWPATARAACKAIVGASREAEAEATTNTRLLADIRQVFDATDEQWMSSQTLLAELKALTEAPWDGWGLTTARLATKLKPFGITSDRSRSEGGRQSRGYRRDQFLDAWARYLPTPAPDEVTAPGVTPSLAQVTPVTPTRGVTDTPVTPEEPSLA
jgi:hypothetical protein